MKKVIIFGCGANGRAAYKKLKNFTQIIAATDNNQSLWNTCFFDVQIFKPLDAINYALKEDAYIIIAIEKYREIEEQIKSAGCMNYLIWREFQTLKHDLGKALVPYSLNKLETYKKKDKKNLSILYLQTQACIRTLKISKAVSENGVEVSLAYYAFPPESDGYEQVYTNIYPVESIYDFVDFLNRSEFDLIHSSNEPDYLTILAQMSNIPVIHDCHDLRSGYLDLYTESRVVELLANKNSAGVIYTSESVRQQAIEQFHVPSENTYVIENLISRELEPEYKLEKLSAQDRKLHVVYEGGVVGNNRHSHRYFEEIWNKIASENIQLHFYSPGEMEYFYRLEKMNPNIRYEGNISSKKLASEMSQYDVGICILNVTEENRDYLENATPNKVQEYINAGIPVAVGNVNSLKTFVENNEFGKYLDLNSNIEEQLRLISRIQIKSNVLYEKGMTLESKIPGLISFYQSIKKKYKRELYEK